MNCKNKKKFSHFYIITNETKGETYQAAAFPPFIQSIIKAGGLLKSLKERGE